LAGTDPVDTIGGFTVAAGVQKSSIFDGIVHK
jgi:hypothetical protein